MFKIVALLRKTFWKSNFVLLFWCCRKCPLIWFLTCPSVVFLLPCQTTASLWMASTIRMLQEGQHPNCLWLSVEVSLLSQTKQMKVKCQTMCCMLSLTDKNLWLLLEEKSRLQLNKRQNMIQSVFHNLWVVRHTRDTRVQKVWKCVAMSWKR